MPSAILALEDGSVFEGRSFGASAERSGEVVFNTALTGYQEVFTDPSYAGQIVILTNPQIGNYGTNAADNESARPYIEGLVVREFSSITSNWRSDEEAREFLGKHGIPVVSELDTRALVRHLRTRGVMRGVLSAIETDAGKLVAKARQIPTMAGLDLASRVSTPEPYGWDTARRTVLAFRVGAAARRTALSCSRLRFRHQAEHPAAPGAGGLPRHRGSGADLRRRCPGAEARWRVPLQRPRRPRTASNAGGQHAQADRQEAHLRHLPGPPDSWAWRSAAALTS